VERPGHHTAEGGVLLGEPGAAHRMVLYEDPQCPYCRQFEELAGDLVAEAVASGGAAVEYRMRSFLGPESVRADNALAAAAEAGRFDDLRRDLFAHQPPEQTGGYTVEDLLAAGERVGLTEDGYTAAVRTGRYEEWVRAVDESFQREDPEGTPAADLDGLRLDASTLFDLEELARRLG
jgi:protein-disulfide isomerase